MTDTATQPHASRSGEPLGCRSSGLGRLVLSRLGQAVLAALGASVLVWALIPLAPGDTADRVLRARGVSDPTSTELDAIRTELGLHRPLVVQYATWLGDAARGDFSNSYRSQRPVLDELRERLPATATLAGVAVLLAVAMAVPAGVISAAYRGRWPDSMLRGVSLLGAGLPAFLVGLVILHLVVLRMGYGRALSDGSLSQVWLPALVLAFGRFADWSRLLRAGLLEAMSSGYAEVAEARGASRLRKITVHALPNASIPFLTTVGVGIGALIGGSPIIEAVFTWPGVGSYVVSAIGARDLPVIQGFAALAALVYVGTSLTVDLIAGLVDPRTRQGTA